MNNYIDKMKEELDKLRDIKFKELDIFFEENEKKLIKLKKEYLEARKNIEEYYEINKKFFHIEKEENDDSNNKAIINNNYCNNYIDDIDNSSPNRDIENDVFLLNFELMNLCDTKNLENINFIKNIKNRIDSFNNQINTELTEDSNIISNFINLNTKPDTREEDNYWDVNIRTKKYTEIIEQFRDTICDIYHRTGNLEKLKDLIDILDSKLKKNNKIIFDQEYFQEENNAENNKENISRNEQRNTTGSIKRNCSASNKRSSSRTKSLKKYNTERLKIIIYT